MPRPATWREVITAVQRLAEQHLDRTVFVGIDGFGATGKSSLADAIADAVPRAVVVAVDDFADPQVPEWDWGRFENEFALPLRKGRPAQYQVGRWNSGITGVQRSVSVGAVVVVEGVSSTRREVNLPWDLTVWVTAARDVRVRRALERDGPGLLTVWVRQWMPTEEAYAAREHPQDRVDLVVDGEGSWT
jgi:uridine kinase